MADAKRYWWLRLPKDFFKSKRIKKLRKIAGGDTYTIIYLKMQLLSLQTEGMLFFDGVEDSFSEEIALDIDEDADDVALTISYLVKTGLLIQQDSETHSLPYVKDNIGCETAVAERVRKHREKVKLLHCNADVTDEKQLCNVEKEIEKEIEIDKKKRSKFSKENMLALIDERFSLESMKSILSEWIAYKIEIKSPYKGETGFNSFLTKVENYVKEYGEEQTILSIKDAMSNSYKGFNPDWLKGTKKKPVHDFEQRDYDFDDLESKLLSN